MLTSLRLAALCLALAHSGWSADERDIDAIMQPYNRNSGPGCAVAVVQSGAVVHRKGYGMADLDHNVPITPDSVFHVASLSKQFTATAIYLLGKEQKLALSDPVGRYVKDLPPTVAAIKIEELLHHTSGLRDAWQLLLLSGWRVYEDPIRLPDVMNLLRRQISLDFPAGSQFEYSNAGYILLGEVVSRVNGRPLGDYLAEKVFRPLALQRTRVRNDHREIVTGQAYAYAREPDGPWLLRMPNLDVSGATNLLTTVSDLAAWAAVMDNPQVPIDPDILDRLYTAGKRSNGSSTDYGGGLFTGQYRGLRIVEHSGSDAGYSAHFLRFPERKLTVVCLCNTAAGPRDLTRRIADLFLRGDLTDDAPAPTVPLSASELKTYEATFVHRADHRVRRLVFAGQKLRLDVDTILYALHPLGDHRFRNPNQETIVEIEFDSNHRPLTLTETTSAHDSFRYEREQPWSPSPAELTRYVGEYRSAELDTRYNIALQQNQLLLTAKKDLREELEPTIPDGFNSGLGHLWWRKDAAGLPSGFVLSGERARNLVFERVTGRIRKGEPTNMPSPR